MSPAWPFIPPTGLALPFPTSPAPGKVPATPQGTRCRGGGGSCACIRSLKERKGKKSCLDANAMKVAELGCPAREQEIDIIGVSSVWWGTIKIIDGT